MKCNDFCNDNCTCGTPGDEPSGLTHNEVAEHVTRAFNDGYTAGIAAEREKRNKPRRKVRPTTKTWPTTNDGGQR